MVVQAVYFLHLIVIETNTFSIEYDSYTVVESDGYLEVRIYRSHPSSQEGSVGK